MAYVQEILDALDRVAPSRLAFSWDKIGLQVGSRDTLVERAVVSLDRSRGAILYAVEENAQLLLTHHPLIFDPLPSVTADTYEGRAIQTLMFYGISHVSAHTNWDAATGGINDTLASLLGLTDVRSFGSSAGADELKLVVFAPTDSADSIVDACAQAGAGAIGNYRRCAFLGQGQGTYEAGPDANPAIGNAGERSTVEEARIEMVCHSSLVNPVVRALRSAHPYEEPAFDLIPLKTGYGQAMGRIGALAEPLSLQEFAARVDSTLGTRSQAWGRPEKHIQNVAVVGGAADGEWQKAKSAGADVLVTGEVKQHVALEAADSGFAILASGHYATEHPGCSSLRDRMAEEVPDVEWSLFEPEPGYHGRPL